MDFFVVNVVVNVVVSVVDVVVVFLFFPSLFTSTSKWHFDVNVGSGTTVASAKLPPPPPLEVRVCN